MNNIGNEGYASLRRFPININTNGAYFILFYFSSSRVLQQVKDDLNDDKTANPRIERGGIVDELYGIYNDAYNTLGTTYNEKCNVM